MLYVRGHCLALKASRTVVVVVVALCKTRLKVKTGWWNAMKDLARFDSVVTRFNVNTWLGRRAGC